MPYRRTERVLERLAGRREDILRASRDIAAEQGLGAVQIVPVAERAGIAAGTVYRYFPTKADLVEALLKTIAEQEIAVIRNAAGAAPGPLSALAAAIVAFLVRTMQRPGLLAAVLTVPAERELDGLRLVWRRALVAEFEAAIRAAIAAGRLPEQEAKLAAAAVFGVLAECAAGPLAPGPADPAERRLPAQAAALLALRALGVADARARGLVVQAPWPAEAG
ncbi:MAG: TetR/AcrR family transcriptional regulator [Rhodoplanes sp.]